MTIISYPNIQQQYQQPRYPQTIGTNQYSCTISLRHSKQHAITTHVLLTEGIAVFFVGVVCVVHAASNNTSNNVSNSLDDEIENIEGWSQRWSVMVLLNGTVTLGTPHLV